MRASQVLCLTMLILSSTCRSIYFHCILCGSKRENSLSNRPVFVVQHKRAQLTFDRGAVNRIAFAVESECADALSYRRRMQNCDGGRCQVMPSTNNCPSRNVQGVQTVRSPMRVNNMQTAQSSRNLLTYYVSVHTIMHFHCILWWLKCAQSGTGPMLYTARPIGTYSRRNQRIVAARLTTARHQWNVSVRPCHAVI